jgi:hypothetical protein
MKRFGDYSEAVRSAAIDALSANGTFWNRDFLQTFDPNSTEVLQACEDAEKGVQAKHQGLTAADAVPGKKAKPLYAPKPQRDDYSIVLLHQLHGERYWRLNGYTPEGRANLTLQDVAKVYKELEKLWPGDFQAREDQAEITDTLLARLSRAEARMAA